MPKFDIMPLTDVVGGNRVVGITASQTFEMGELVGVVDAGTVTEFPQDNTQAILADIDGGKLCGISCYGPGASNINTKTGTTTWGVGTPVAFWPADRGIEFITKNFWTAGGATTVVVPAVTDIGEPYQITYNTTATGGTPGWGVEQTAGVDATDIIAVVTRVLDANKKDIRESGQAGVYLVFELKTSL